MIYLVGIGGTLSSRQSTFILIAFLLLTAVMLGGVIWASSRIASQEIGGEYFLIQWIAIRAKVVDGISPYSITASNRISDQVEGVYLWDADTEPVYTEPLFSAVLTLPFSLIQDVATAHTLWLVVQFLVVLLTILAAVRLTGWRPSWWVFSFMLLLVLFSLRTLQSWYQGSMMIWVLGLVAGELLAIQGKRFELAGFLLALTMIQPQVMIIWVVFVLFWAGAQHKWRLVFWFFSSLVFLGVLAAFLVPDWLMQYLRILWNFGNYFPPGGPGFAFQQWWPGLGRQMGWALSALLGLILLVEWWLAARRDFRWFLWTACLTLVVSTLIGLPVNPDGYILLTLPFFLVGAVFDERWRRGGKWVVFIGIFLVFAWEWYLFITSLGNLQSGMKLLLIFPMPVMLLISLYWARWWAIRPKRLLIDELRASETY